MKSLLALVMLLFCNVVIAQSKAPAAKNVNDAQQKIDALRKEIKTLSKAQQEIEEKRNLETKQLRQIDLKVAQSSQNLNQVVSAISTQEQKLGQLETKQQQLQREFAEQRDQWIELIRAMYRLRNNSELKQLLSQDTLTDSARWQMYHHYFGKQRQHKMAQLSLQLKNLADVSTAIETEKNKLARQKEQQQQVVQQLSGEQQKRNDAVNQLDKKFKTQQERIVALGKDEKALRSLLNKLSQAANNTKAPPVIGRPSNTKTPPRSTPKSLTGWPLTGNLLAGYGGAMPDGRKSEGLLIAAPAGTPVHSVAAGRVVYADWLKGYGLLLVIDHGRGYMSLYANNDALFKEVGDAVSAGERLSSVGSSGAQARSALYFEMRLNGQPQNPNAWLRP